MRGIVVPSLVLSVSVGLAPGLGWAESPVGDRAVAEQLVAEVSRSGSDSSKVAARPIEAASRALQRAKATRDAGDVIHAAHLEGLAREWAETARDLVRAAKTEAEATDLEQRASKASLRSERARALLEETIARKGEATAQLERVEKPAEGERARPVRPGKRPAEARPSVPERPATPERPTAAMDVARAKVAGDAASEVVPARTERSANDKPERAEATRAAPKPVSSTTKTEPAKVQP